MQKITPELFRVSQLLSCTSFDLQLLRLQQLLTCPAWAKNVRLGRAGANMNGAVALRAGRWR